MEQTGLIIHMDTEELSNCRNLVFEIWWPIGGSDRQLIITDFGIC